MAVLTALSYSTIILLTIHLTTTWYTPLYRIKELPLSLTTIHISLRTIHMVVRPLHTCFKTLPTNGPSNPLPVQHYRHSAGLHCPMAHKSRPKEPFHHPLTTSRLAMASRCSKSKGKSSPKCITCFHTARSFRCSR
jgi:hypothetical protein